MIVSLRQILCLRPNSQISGKIGRISVKIRFFTRQMLCLRQIRRFGRMRIDVKKVEENHKLGALE